MSTSMETLPGSKHKAVFEPERLFDRRSFVIGASFCAALIVGATMWQLAYVDNSRKGQKLNDFQFAPRPPDTQKFELKEPQRELMKELVQDQTQLDEKEKPNIQITTEPKDSEMKEDVIKTQVEMNPEVNVKVAQLDLDQTMEKADQVDKDSADALTPIAVETSQAADIYRYDVAKPTAHKRAKLVSTAPKIGMTLKVAPRQYGDQDVVAVGELGAVDINLLGSGDYLGGLGRGGMLETRTAVDNALRWLSLHQESEGWWSQKRWDLEDVGFEAPAANRGEHNTGVTGFALLALMGGGHTLRKGEHRMTVIRTVEWLLKQQNARTGYVSANMYEHAICTIALCEAFGRSPDERVGLAARKAVDACVAAIAKDGGWRYTPNPDESDVSVTSWFLQALKTAKLANIKFDHSAFSKGISYLDQCTDKAALRDSNGAVGYQYKPDLNYGSGSPALTCAGMVIRQFNGMGVKHPLLCSAAELTKQRPPDWDKEKDFYYWYYATYAMHNMGGEYRLLWNRRIRDTLLDHQSKRGHQSGSWNPKAVKWDAGRVYTTALGALCLEVYYRYGEALQSFGTVPDIEELFFQR